MPSAVRDSRQSLVQHSWLSQVTCPSPWYPYCRSCPCGLCPVDKGLPQLLPISEGLPREPRDDGIDPVGIISTFSLGITTTCRTARMPCPPQPQSFRPGFWNNGNMEKFISFSFRTWDRWKEWSRPSHWPRILYLNPAFYMRLSNHSENLSSWRTREQGGLRWAQWASFSGMMKEGTFQAWVKTVRYWGSEKSWGKQCVLEGAGSPWLSANEALGWAPVGANQCQFIVQYARGFPRNSLHQEASLCVLIILARECAGSTFLILP